MADGMRSREHSGVLVKNKNSSGCLIVKNKGDESGGVRSSEARKVPMSKKERKMPTRDSSSDSGSNDGFLTPPPRTTNCLAIYEKGIAEDTPTGRKRIRDENIRRNEDAFIGRDSVNLSGSKRNKLDVFDFDEYNAVSESLFIRKNSYNYSGDEVGYRKILGSRPLGMSNNETEYESGSSRQFFSEKKNKKKKTLYNDQSSSLTRVNHDKWSRLEADEDNNQPHLPSTRERFSSGSDEPIRVQGKNGVLKVMVNKKKVSGSVKSFGHLETEGGRTGFHAEKIALGNPGSRAMKKQIKVLKSALTKKSMGFDSDLESEDSDMSQKLTPKTMAIPQSTKKVSCKEGKAQGEQLLARAKEVKVKRACGTEKQKLREQIRGMLLDAGWTIDYRPRRNRDYQDAVYVNPSGTAFWSIIKAYDALMKQLNHNEDEAKHGDSSGITPLPDEALGQLTRKTRKKMEKELKRKQRDGFGGEHSKLIAPKRSLVTRNDEESEDGPSNEGKLSSFLKQGTSLKSRTTDNGAFSVSTECEDSTVQLHGSAQQPSSISGSHIFQGRKSKKLGRCTLLVRSSNQELGAETDRFVPYAGKRTLLSWLIDCGTVELSQKVKYMNRRCTKVILQGWITRDGIHCGCCSKILTVSKFELHAGSKLRQPFQNIYLDSGSSLLQCLRDAWIRQEGSEKIDFNSVATDGDDPNDDTCGLCGDGGDLICCDGCPSTFHQSCLNIEHLPSGDWHCPNCTCKFCGGGSNFAEVDDAIHQKLLACNMCETKYHQPCKKETDPLPDDSNNLALSFCGNNCIELFEHLQKYLGVRNELEAGFSWSLIRRTNVDSDTAFPGLAQRVECNSKLAIAATIMDECFLPIIDRRSGINLIHNSLYNCGSNFNRLNYHGFYTAILERGDEIISAASLRFHGTQLAEMPFIGTRHIYRRQGMCRRLFLAIESALCSLNVEKLVIPAIAELAQTWTGVFGFTPVGESLKQEMRSLNMLVFPGIDMLQKSLQERDTTDGTMSPRTGEKSGEIKSQTSHMVADKSENDSEAQHSDGVIHHTCTINGEVAAQDDSARSESPVEVNTLSSKDSDEDVNQAEGYEVSASDEFKIEVPVKEESNTHSEDHSQPCKECDLNDANADHEDLSTSMENEFAVSVEGTKDSQTHKESDMNDVAAFNEDQAVRASSCKETEDNDANAVHDTVAASDETKFPVSLENTMHADSDSRAKFDGSYDEDEMEDKTVSDIPDSASLRSREENRAEDNNGATHADLDSREKLDLSTSDRKTAFQSGASHDVVEMEDKTVSNIPISDSPRFREKNRAEENNGTVHAVLDSREKFDGSTSGKSAFHYGASHDEVEMEDKTVYNIPVSDSSHSHKENRAEENKRTMHADTDSRDGLDGSVSDRKSFFRFGASHDKVEENKLWEPTVSQFSDSCEENHSLNENAPEIQIEENAETMLSVKVETEDELESDHPVLGPTCCEEDNKSREIIAEIKTEEGNETVHDDAESGDKFSQSDVSSDKVEIKNEPDADPCAEDLSAYKTAAVKMNDELSVTLEPRSTEEAS